MELKALNINMHWRCIAELHIKRVILGRHYAIYSKDSVSTSNFPSPKPFQNLSHYSFTAIWYSSIVWPLRSIGNDLDV